MDVKVISTWSFGPVGNEPALALLRAGGSALDAAVLAATKIEDDESIHSVGVGGIPDAEGRATLDACVMTNPDRCGSVACVRDYPNPAAIARRVMEKTIHVMLVGEGAEAFAAREGFAKRRVLTEAAKLEWEKWSRDARSIDRDKYRGWLPPIDEEGGPEASHDTVGVLALDQRGQLAGVCSTSGMAFKTPGRVGDSPIIGHGLYVDQEAGGAAATGTGELVTGVCGTFLAVELMRQGRSPREAAVEVIRRIASRFRIVHDHQVAIVAMAPDGRWGSAALHRGFSHTISDSAGTRVERVEEEFRD